MDRARARDSPRNWLSVPTRRDPTPGSARRPLVSGVSGIRKIAKLSWNDMPTAQTDRTSGLSL